MLPITQRLSSLVVLNLEVRGPLGIRHILTEDSQKSPNLMIFDE